MLLEIHGETSPEAYRAGSSRKGATTVEFAVVATVMFLMLFGLLEFGRVAMLKQSMTNAASEGVRRAALASTQNANDVISAIRGHLKGSIAEAANPAIVRISLNPTNFSGIASGTTITIDVRANFADVSWLPNPLFAKHVEMHAHAHATRE